VGADKVLYAVVGRWEMDRNHAEQQQAFLTERIVPSVSRAEGFVSGYWSRPGADDVAYSFVVFDDEASAAAFADSVRRDPHDRRATGVHGNDLTIVQIAAMHPVAR
jgi:hypothetical protein